MSLCINDDLIWISTPKCASASIEKAFYDSSLSIKHFFYKNRPPRKHLHSTIDPLYNEFGIKETVCIKRDYFDRWLSSLRFLWDKIESEKYEPIIKWEDIDNDFIYQYFDQSFIDKIHNINPPALNVLENKSEMFNKINELDSYFLKDKNIKWNGDNGLYIIFYSQSYWTNCKKCTYEFNITEIDKFENFVSDRYSIDFKVPILNTSTKRPNKIVVDDDLRNWVYDNFEKRFIKEHKLL